MKKYFLAFAIFIAFVACGVPADNEVEAAFKKDHPTYTVLSVGTGEGDGSATYFHIKYKKPGDENLHENVWQYVNSSEKKWVVNHKETIK